MSFCVFNLLNVLNVFFLLYKYFGVGAVITYLIHTLTFIDDVKHDAKNECFDQS